MWVSAGGTYRFCQVCQSPRAAPSGMRGWRGYCRSLSIPAAANKEAVCSHHHDSHPNPHIIHHLQILTFPIACQLSSKPLLRVPSLSSHDPIHRVDHWCKIIPHFQSVLEVLVLLLLLMLFQNLCRFLLPIGFGIHVRYTHIKDVCTAVFPEPMAACITPLFGGGGWSQGAYGRSG